MAVNSPALYPAAAALDYAGRMMSRVESSENLAVYGWNGHSYILYNAPGYRVTKTRFVRPGRIVAGGGVFSLRLDLLSESPGLVASYRVASRPASRSLLRALPSLVSVRVTVDGLSGNPVGQEEDGGRGRDHHDDVATDPDQDHENNERAKRKYGSGKFPFPGEQGTGAGECQERDAGPLNGVRRRSGMRRCEFADHHQRVHAGESECRKPRRPPKYGKKSFGHHGLQYSPSITHFDKR